MSPIFHEYVLCIKVQSVPNVLPFKYEAYTGLLRRVNLFVDVSAIYYYLAGIRYCVGLSTIHQHHVPHAIIKQFPNITCEQCRGELPDESYKRHARLTSSSLYARMLTKQRGP